MLTDFQETTAGASTLGRIMSSRGRKNLPVGSLIFSSAEAHAIRDKGRLRTRVLLTLTRATGLLVHNRQLFRRRRECRQLVDVARVMLDDDGRLEIRGDLLEALERRHRLGAIEVERRHTIRIVILAEVRGI